eukprot:scaffold32791_cov56-Attheya_sp.AAC.1
MADVVFGDCLGWENGVPPLSKTLTIDSEYNGDDSEPANILDKVTVKEPGQEKIEKSKVQKIQKDLFYFDELSLGNQLGQGCFGVVFEVQQFMPLADNDSNFDEDRLFARQYYADRNNQDPTGKCKYAVKLEERRMATAPLFTKKPASESMKKKKILVERLR